jgi:hypothetical protein
VLFCFLHHRPCFSCIIEALMDLMQLTVEQLYSWQGPLQFGSSACTCSFRSSSTNGSAQRAAAGSSRAGADSACSAAGADGGPQLRETGANVIPSPKGLAPEGWVPAAPVAAARGNGAEHCDVPARAAGGTGGSPTASPVLGPAPALEAAAASPEQQGCVFVPLEVGVDTLAGMGGCSNGTKCSTEPAGVTAVLQEVLRIDSSGPVMPHSE